MHPMCMQLASSSRTIRFLKVLKPPPYLLLKNINMPSFQALRLQTGADGEVSTHSDATQANPTFSREGLGAVVSGCKDMKSVRNKQIIELCKACKGKLFGKSLFFSYLCNPNQMDMVKLRFVPVAHERHLKRPPWNRTLSQNMANQAQYLRRVRGLPEF